MRKVHRIIALFAFLLGLYIALTGLTVQSMDLYALLTHAPATNPTIQAIHAGIDGPPNFQVIRDPDYSARALPPDFNFDNALEIAVRSGHKAAVNAPLAFVEFRVLDGKPVGLVGSSGWQYRFDAVTGGQEGEPVEIKLQPLSRPSLRNTIKDFHRMRAFGNWGLVLDMISGLIILAMVFTGLYLYIELLRSRSKIQRSSPIWFAGGWLRTLHRVIASLSGVFIAIMATTGTIISISSIGVSLSVAREHGRPEISEDLSSPLTDSELPSMLHKTLVAYRSTESGAPVKVLRLRYFAGMPQGIVISGGDDTRQLAYNAATGRAVSETEPGYPPPGQTFGWQVDETTKRIHRGDYFGLSGRFISLLSGFAFLYLIVSGGVMYAGMWNKRSKSGRRALVWR